MQIGLTHLIDERLLEFAEETRQFNATRQPGVGPTGIEELRRVRAAQTPFSADTRATEHTAEAENRCVPVRVTLPRQREIRGALLDIHAGGFYLGANAGDDTRNARLADALGVAVVSVQYRLAPEHPWPAAPEDCETAALWLLEHAETTFGTTCLAIIGASAGSNLAMTTLLRLRHRALIHRFTGAVLQFGAYDLAGQTPGGRRYADEYFIRAYAAHAPDCTDPDISPLYADLTNLPPTLLLIGAQDPVLEDNLALAARLSAAHNDIDLRVYPESPHAFTFRPTPMAAAAHHDIDTWLDHHLTA
ncbi:alpha/beta hydrolase [Nocardia sp. NPDC004068]|uniref:alpha/beta hydrolase n=1 Tax=Nocardia sp. NPDC004068 TaxID=3364303 RepID=UPI003679E3D8